MVLKDCVKLAWNAQQEEKSHFSFHTRLETTTAHQLRTVKFQKLYSILKRYVHIVCVLRVPKYMLSIMNASNQDQNNMKYFELNMTIFEEQ